MVMRLITSTLVAGFLSPLFPAAAQTLDLATLKEEIALLSGVFQEGLGLGNSSSFLGFGNGRIESLYLSGQGVVMEIRTPLANQRSRLSLSALASSLRNVAGRENPLAPTAPRQEQADRSERVLPRPEESVATEFQETVTESRSSDYQADIYGEISRASRLARMLRDMGAMEPNTLVATEQSLAALRRESEINLQQLRQLEVEAGTQQLETTTSSSRSRLRELHDTLASISNRAMQQASELDDRIEAAREEQRQRWMQDVAALESDLFDLLCEFGVTLESLPAGEHVSIILVGLGSGSEGVRHGDLIHVVSRNDLVACQAGDLDVDTLQQRTVSYDY